MTTRREFIHVSAAAAAVSAVGLGAAGCRSAAPDGDEPGDGNGPGAESTEILGWDQIQLPGTPDPALQAAAWVTSPAIDGGNVLVVRAGKKVTVVDCKQPWCAVSILEDVQTLTKVIPMPWNLSFVNTHHHSEQTFGNLALAATPNRVCHVNAVERIKNAVPEMKQAHVDAAGDAQDQIDNADPQDPPVNSGMEPTRLSNASLAAGMAGYVNEVTVVPGKQVGGTQNVALDGTATPIDLIPDGSGHTDNDLVVHVVDLDLIHVGDLVYNQIHPFMDIDDGTDVKLWIDRLTSLIEDPMPGINTPRIVGTTVVVPGHGKVGGRKIVEDQIGYLKKLVEVVGEAKAAGNTADQVVAMTFPFMQGLANPTGADGMTHRDRAIRVTYEQV